MFEAAEVGNRVDKADYDALVPDLREQLLDAQHDLRSAPFSMLLVVIGDDRQGCEEVIDLLNEWLDARFITTESFERPSDEERERPPFWRYMRALAPRGRTSLFLGAWFLHTIDDLLAKRVNRKVLQARLEHMSRHERMLADDGTLILKFWLHMPRKEHKRRLKKAGADKADRWQVTDVDAAIADNYDEVAKNAEAMIRTTNAVYAPWHVIESTDRRHRNLAVGRTILQALRARLDGAAAAIEPRPVQTEDRGRGVLDTVDLTAALPDAEYEKRLAKAQGKLHKLQQRARERERTTVLVFEGWDAAGKGGAIRRITGVLPACDYRVVPIAAPTEEERSYHYLWRFWRQLPRAGRMLVFDRSWYGRVLVERVEAFARPDEWLRAYDEIVDFEQQLVEHGILVLKFWLHLDADEQMRRFKEREQTGHKRHKITDEDYRNRDKWPDYTQAANDMFARTSTDLAPWHLVAANDKRHARVQVMETLCKAMKKHLG